VGLSGTNVYPLAFGIGGEAGLSIETKLNVCRRTKDSIDVRTKQEHISSMFSMEGKMIRTIFEEAAAVLAIALFVGMIAVWAGVLSSGW
jgi:histidine ammonia-lyase